MNLGPGLEVCSLRVPNRNICVTVSVALRVPPLGLTATIVITSNNNHRHGQGAHRELGPLHM